MTDLDYRNYPICIVDDEAAIVTTFKNNFDDDFTVVGATKGADALDAIRRDRVAVLVADQRMPDMHGIEVILQAIELQPDLVPIILTGYTDFDALVDAVNLGRIFRYIAKPWNRDEIELTLRRAIEAVHLTRENTRLSDEKRWVVVAPAGGRGMSVLLARAATDVQRASIGNQTGGRVAFFIDTDDFATDHAAMVAAGVHFIEEPRKGYYGWVCVFTDPYGNKWDLVERTA